VKTRKSRHFALDRAALIDSSPLAAPANRSASIRVRNARARRINLETRRKEKPRLRVDKFQFRAEFSSAQLAERAEIEARRIASLHLHKAIAPSPRLSVAYRGD
jgi:hypothetical protein